MKRDHISSLSRSVACVALGTVLVVGVAGVAGAEGSKASHDRGARSETAIPANFVGKITALSATSLTLQREYHHRSVTIAIAPSTTFFEGSSAVTASALAVGEHVNVLMSTITQMTAARITITLDHVTGTVSAVSTNVITLSSGVTHSVDVTSSTTFTENGVATTLASVIVGDRVAAAGVVSADRSSLNALSVTVSAPKDLNGTVTALTTTSITVKKSNGTSVTIALTPTTTYAEGSTAVTSSALALGEQVNVELSSTVALSATRVNIELAKVSGTVGAVSGNVITITNDKHVTHSVDVSSATTYTEGGATVTLASVIVGAKLTATGILSADGTTLSATSVLITAPSAVVGTLTALTSSSVTVKEANGTSVVLALVPTTTYVVGSTAVTASSLMLGEHVTVQLSTTASLTAARITIVLAKVSGTVSAIGAGVITITGGEGFVRTIDVSSTTTYTEGSTTVTLSAVTVGSKITATGVVSSNGVALIAMYVSISVPKDVSGTITALSATSVTLKASNGTSVTVSLAPTTTYFEGSTAVGASALIVGENVHVLLSATVPFGAARVDINLAKVSGTVSAIGAGVITITGGEGFVRTIDVSSTTTYTEGSTPVTLSAVTVGSKINATGVVSANGLALNAMTVNVETH